jgi:nitrite reductase (NADH) large subunit
MPTRIRRVPSYQFIDETSASYRRLVVDATGKRVLGAVLIGDNSYYDTLLQYMQNALPCRPNRPR